MPDLKTVLFEHAKKYYERYKEFEKLLGADNEMTIKCANKYYGCDFVIRDSGLREEYETWLKNQEKEVKNDVNDICDYDSD